MRVVVLSRRDFLKLGTAGAATISLAGCGTILYPERVGQPHCGPLDWKVVALDTIGLLLFFIPGVIAFVVDFYNGTIYLPPSYPCTTGRAMIETRKLVSVNVPKDELNRERIEQVVSQHVAKNVRLDDGTYRTKQLTHLDDYWTTRDTMASSSPDRP
jgi:hypothetical protein